MARFLFSLIFLIPIFGFTQPLTPIEREELIKWTRGEGKGTLLTPPIGSVDKSVSLTKKYITAIVKNIMPADFETRFPNLVINIYASEQVNAWVQEFSPDDTYSQEGQFKKAHPNEIWPIRRLLKLTNNLLPIHELGVTTGLLNKLKSESELAFILGHEITHITEGHVHREISEALEHWLSGQLHEAIADTKGVDLIIGKYELGGATEALEKIHQSDKAPNLDDAKSGLFNALSAGAGSHHQEGVRISSVQAYVEYLRRHDVKGKPMVDKSLPIRL
ncbi:MAG: M48 family metalloprotease [Pseudomonadota bacterium]|nr:M48 family metalloprotease [Pseudomonadota bacterium]